MPRDADPPGHEVDDLDVGPVDADVIESAPRRAGRSGRPALLVPLLVVALAAAGVGYLVGSHRAATRTPAVPFPEPLPLTSLPLPAGAQPLTWAGARCGIQRDTRLQLGIEILNRSADTVALLGVKPVLPLGGLRPGPATWGSCGELSPTPADHRHILPAGATTWLTITFDVPACPRPYPVSFSVDYIQAGRSGTAALVGFNDLGDVPYPAAACPGGS